MNNCLQGKLRIITGILVILLATLNSSAQNNNFDNDKTVALVFNNLSAKLKQDLAPQNISVKLIKVEKQTLSKEELVFNGNVSCLIKESNAVFPIEFEAKFDTAAQRVEEVKYTFLDNSFVAPTEEDFLIKHLLNQISKDYKTQNVVIALNSYETKEDNLRQKAFKGTAEVRIGQLEWRKINFDVLTADDVIPVRIEYNFGK